MRLTKSPNLELFSERTSSTKCRVKSLFVLVFFFLTLFAVNKLFHSPITVLIYSTMSTKILFCDFTNRYIFCHLRERSTRMQVHSRPSHLFSSVITDSMNIHEDADYLNKFERKWTLNHGCINHLNNLETIFTHALIRI